MTQPPDQYPQGQPQWWQPGANAPQQPGYPSEVDGSGHQGQPSSGGQWAQQPQYPAQQYPPQGYPAQPYGQPQGQPYAQPQGQPAPAQQYGQPQGQPAPGQPYSQPQSQPMPGQQYAQPYGDPAQPQSQPTPAQPQDQPGATYGGGFQPSEYGGLGAFSAADKKPRSKKPLLIAGAVVVVLAAAGGISWATGVFSGDTLEQKSLQDGVSRVLNESYGEPDVKNVSCPSGQKVGNGVTFDCTVQVGGQPKKVTVRVLNDKPEYSVGAPH
ncbi:DUF4333 domain-containing protein [Amycolatopsis benzoatilytica]|uniref:DUF4333 domain-containing protein n=1 Tax=Amycolatopsis benzoatilytica TaxID=346045 RepID=UPI0003629E70|nr:DUF4333 domain-containing protein [Amycolatopsis benzoatilytica]